MEDFSTQMVIADNSESLALLLVDDDAELCEMMREFFAENGHRLECALNGREGLARAIEEDYDLVILDVMLPAISGFTLLHQLRRRRGVPVIMLTARTSQQDRIQGLESGADDYLPKPFDPGRITWRGCVRFCGVLGSSRWRSRRKLSGACGSTRKPARCGRKTS